MNETDLQQIMNMVTGAPFGNAGADPQSAQPPQQGWMQWLAGNMRPPSSGGNSGGFSRAGNALGGMLSSATGIGGGSAAGLLGAL